MAQRTRTTTSRRIFARTCRRPPRMSGASIQTPKSRAVVPRVPRCLAAPAVVLVVGLTCPAVQGVALIFPRDRMLPMAPTVRAGLADRAFRMAQVVRAGRMVLVVGLTYPVVLGVAL